MTEIPRKGSLDMPSDANTQPRERENVSKHAQAAAEGKSISRRCKCLRFSFLQSKLLLPASANKILKFKTFSHMHPALETSTGRAVYLPSDFLLEKRQNTNSIMQQAHLQTNTEEVACERDGDRERLSRRHITTRTVAFRY